MVEDKNAERAPVRGAREIGNEVLRSHLGRQGAETLGQDCSRADERSARAQTWELQLGDRRTWEWLRMKNILRWAHGVLIRTAVAWSGKGGDGCWWEWVLVGMGAVEGGCC